MSTRSITIAALAAATIVLLAGVTFTLVRGSDHESVATVVLTPDTPEPDASLLESFERSGTLGTYVELMASDDTTAEARELGVEITVRAIPDTRAIGLTAVGDEVDVQPALESVIEATRARQETLRDVFVLQVLEAPSSPREAGPGAGLLLLATLLLSGFAALAVVVILRRVAPPPLSSPRHPAGRAESAPAER